MAESSPNMILNILICVKKNCASVATLKSRASRRFSRALRSSQNDDLARRSMLPSSWDVSSARVIAMFCNRLCGFDGRTPLVRKETLDKALRPCRHPSDPLPDAEGLKKWHMIFGMGSRTCKWRRCGANDNPLDCARLYGARTRAPPSRVQSAKCPEIHTISPNAKLHLAKSKQIW